MTSEDMAQLLERALKESQLFEDVGVRRLGNYLLLDINDGDPEEDEDNCKAFSVLVGNLNE